MDLTIDFSRPKRPQILTVDMIPKTSYFTNLRSMLSQEDWDRVKKQCYREAEWRCEICNGVGPKWSVECHEIWDYIHQAVWQETGVKHMQILSGLIALCPKCHMVKHIGFANRQGKFNTAYKHLRKVNRWTKKQADDHITEAVNIWAERSKYQWALNVDFLHEWAGIRDIKVRL